MLVWSTRWQQINIGAPSYALMPKCANHDKLATLRLEFVNYPILLTTYIQINPKKLESVQMLNWIVNVSTNTIFIYTSKDISLLPNWTTLMFKQIMHWSDNHWSKWTPSHDHFPLWHHCAHLNIPKLHNSCVYSWVFKLAWCLQLFWMCENEFGGANVGEKSSINQKWDAWEVRGLNTCANTNMKKKGFCKQPLVIYCFWIWLRGYSLLLRRWTTKKSGMIHIYLIKKGIAIHTYFHLLKV